MTMTFTKSERISHLKTMISQLNINKSRVSNPDMVLIYDKVIEEFEQEIKVIEKSNDKYIIVEL